MLSLCALIIQIKSYFVDINFILFLNAIICCSHEIIDHPAFMRLNLNVYEEYTV